jgi:hypothetical protein
MSKHSIGLMIVLAGVGSSACGRPAMSPPDFSAISRVTAGKPVAVMFTGYSTTLRANGTDRTRLRLAVLDSLSREITSATDSIRLYVTGEGTITAADGSPLPMLTDSAGAVYTPAALVNGVSTLGLHMGTTPGRVKVEARSGTLYPGGHETSAS